MLFLLFHFLGECEAIFCRNGLFIEVDLAMIPKSFWCFFPQYVTVKYSKRIVPFVVLTKVEKVNDLKELKAHPYSYLLLMFWSSSDTFRPQTRIFCWGKFRFSSFLSQNVMIYEELKKTDSSVNNEEVMGTINLNKHMQGTTEASNVLSNLLPLLRGLCWSYERVN